jgi:uncharacterized protein
MSTEKYWWLCDRWVPDGKWICWRGSGWEEDSGSLLAAGADASTKDKCGWTPLHAVAQSYAVDVAVLLIQHGAGVDAHDEHGNSPLWRAGFESRGRGEMIALLRCSGADPELQNFHGVRRLLWLGRLRTTTSRSSFNQPNDPPAWLPRSEGSRGIRERLVVDLDHAPELFGRITNEQGADPKQKQPAEESEREVLGYGLPFTDFRNDQS